MATIAPTAVVDKNAQIGSGVKIGPGCIIEDNVVIGDDCDLVANVMVCRGTRLGTGNTLFAGCVIGEAPQIKGMSRTGDHGQTIIGEGNTFREYVTIHRGSPHGGGKTIVGNKCYLMVYCHLGHDVELEDEVLMANACNIGGHSKIEYKAWFSACSGTHQFVTVGRYVYTGAFTPLTHDAPPYMKIAGSYPTEIRGLNLTGLTRAGFSRKTIQALRQAYRTLYNRKDGKTLSEAVAETEDKGELDPHVRYLLDFLKRSTEHRLNRYREQFR